MEAAHSPVVLPAGVVFCIGLDLALRADAADSSVVMPESFQELRFLPAWQELGCAAHDLSTARAPVLLFVCWEFGMDLWNLEWIFGMDIWNGYMEFGTDIWNLDLWNLVALGAHSLRSAALAALTCGSLSWALQRGTPGCRPSQVGLFATCILAMEHRTNEGDVWKSHGAVWGLFYLWLHIILGQVEPSGLWEGLCRAWFPSQMSMQWLCLAAGGQQGWAGPNLVLFCQHRLCLTTPVMLLRHSTEQGSIMILCQPGSCCDGAAGNAFFVSPWSCSAVGKCAFPGRR